jgi:hypothetical protein
MPDCVCLFAATPAATDIHDLTVSWGASLNVFTRGKGEDVNCDHHRSGPFANLFTDINMGYGLRPFASGGAKDRAAYTGEHPLKI